MAEDGGVAVASETLERIQKRLARMDQARRMRYALSVRQLYRMTQEEFAAFLGMDVSTVSRRERGLLEIPDQAIRALEMAELLYRQGLAP